MKITVFTSNQRRHLDLCNSLRGVASELNVVLESLTLFPGQVSDFYKKSDTMQEYFGKVIESEKKIFGETPSPLSADRVYPLRAGDLNFITPDNISDALDADIYLVFGGSWIRGWLIDFLIENKAINIHMGMSPWYRGAACNFWASHDSNFHLVGATIHYIDKGLDTGGMICHVRPSIEGCSNTFDFTMKSVWSAHQALSSMIGTQDLFDLPSIPQSKALEIKYTRNEVFTDSVAREWLDNEPSMEAVQQQLLEHEETDIFHNLKII